MAQSTKSKRSSKAVPAMESSSSSRTKGLVQQDRESLFDFSPDPRFLMSSSLSSFSLGSNHDFAASEDPHASNSSLPGVLSSSSSGSMRLSTKLRRIKRRLLLEAVGMAPPQYDDSSSRSLPEHSYSQ
ncbi:hypothetical protein ACA910_008679 [Epithemia clementina (nom. ined.)]